MYLLFYEFLVAAIPLDKSHRAHQSRVEMLALRKYHDCKAYQESVYPEIYHVEYDEVEMMTMSNNQMK